jgi:hypothetical protein
MICNMIFNQGNCNTGYPHLLNPLTCNKMFTW